MTNQEKTGLTLMDTFSFRCHEGLDCFTKCCADVNIYLGPYDVIRLKNRLGLTAAQFLDQYAYMLTTHDQIIPLVVLKMGEGEDKSCPFVGEQGCTVYEDRPWPCRLYPLDMTDEDTFQVMVDPEKCHGLKEHNPIRVIEWMEDQGVMEYQRAHNYFAEITGHAKFKELDITNEKVKSMILLATYNMDRFRDFVLESPFLKIFDLEESYVEQLKYDDTELLRLGLDWIKFGLYGERTMKLRPEVLEAARKKGADAGGGFFK